MTHDYRDIRDYRGQDLAKKYRSSHAPLDAKAREALEADLRTIAEQGFVIHESVLTQAEVLAINAALAPLYKAPGRNGIEGWKTRRINGLLSKTRACDALV